MHLDLSSAVRCPVLFLGHWLLKVREQYDPASFVAVLMIAFLRNSDMDSLTLQLPSHDGFLPWWLLVVRKNLTFSTSTTDLSCV